MPTENWTYPGSRWWKCDLHLHTPGSYDYEDRPASAEDWVRAATQAGLDVAAVTDHNAHAWIRNVQEVARASDLVVFPGVELTVSGGIHLLALLDTDRNSDAVAVLLGACGVRDEDIGTDAARSPLTLVQAMQTIAENRGGICIPAHADGKDGFLKALVEVREDGSNSGNRTVQDIVCSPHLLGVEVTGENTALLAYLDDTKEGYRRSGGPLPLLEGSDAHRLAEIGRRVTWIKMSKPNLEGIRLALLDGDMSVRRGTSVAKDLNAHATDVIESIQIENAKYLGRGVPFELRLNPWLNCIIGGRGTGKSSVVELVRVAMRREDELPEALRPDFEQLKKVPTNRQDRGLLTPDTVVRVVFRRDGSRYRVQWSQREKIPAIEEEAAGGVWVMAPGEVRSRFPVRIFSQKQIFEMAAAPNALLRIVDDAAAVNAAAWRANYEQEETRFFSLRAKERELQAELKDEARVRGALDDVRRKISVHESSEHREVLSAYEVTERRQRAIETWADELERMVQRIESIPNELIPKKLGSEIFPVDAAEGSPERLVLDAMSAAMDELGDIRGEVVVLAARARAVVEKFRASLASVGWPAQVAAVRERYGKLLEELRSIGADDPAEYGRLVQGRQALEDRLRDLEVSRRAIGEVSKQATESLYRLGKLREELTIRRRRFLHDVLMDNPHVRIEVLFGGDHQDAERKLREIIGKTDQTFQDQIWSEDGNRGVLCDLYRAAPPEQEKRFRERLAVLKQKLVGVAAGNEDAELHGKFVAHLRKLPPEASDRIDAMFPEDAVRVSYCPRAGEAFRPIEQGSPGQKTAAILAFVLSHGTEPLILDQPEDDLDNQLISDLIVTQIRQSKARRQMIVVTHNPNIVVNGDAELVFPFDVGGGQTHVGAAGGLQERKVRDVICAVMEGGKDALERRYRRIRGGDGHV